MRKAAISLLFAAALMPAQPDHKMTKADIDRWMTELSNWGRWGKDDQLGTLNLITPAKRREAVALVKEGYSISMAHNVLTEKAVDNENPFVHTMLPRPADSTWTTTTFHTTEWVRRIWTRCATPVIRERCLMALPWRRLPREGCLKDSVIADQDRHPDTRRDHRYREIEGRGLSGTGHADLSGRSGGVGEANRRESLSRGCRFRS